MVQLIFSGFFIGVSQGTFLGPTSFNMHIPFYYTTVPKEEEEGGIWLVVEHSGLLMILKNVVNDAMHLRNNYGIA